jgi:hypothetical protein
MRQSANYEIRIEGNLSQTWSEWLAGMAIRACPDGSSLLTGRLEDQAALYGVLIRLRDLGLPLLSVRRSDDPLPQIDPIHQQGN